MAAALELPAVSSTTPHAIHTLIGLLAATGMRRSEATSLRIRDLTEDGIKVRNTKSATSRLLPLHPSVKCALDAWLGIRGRGAPDDPLFILSSGRPVCPEYLTNTFIKLARNLGLRGGPGTPGPRLHDLRHSFAATALARVTAGDRGDISRHMLALSTWMGHARLVDTYYYLEATPVLLNRISAATEALHSRRRNDD